MDLLGLAAAQQDYAMTSRRDFLKSATVAALAAGGAPLIRSRETEQAPRPMTADIRAYWCETGARLAEPMLSAAATGKLKELMPVEAKVPADRAPFTRLEGVARLLAGLAPWLELEGGSASEQAKRSRLAELGRRSIAGLLEPASPDVVDFARPGQTLVDAAFLAQALLRAPKALWKALPEATQRRLLAALAQTRVTTPPESNWVLFASMVEAALLEFGGVPDNGRLAYGLKRHQKWYLGDGIYGDGPDFHWDYYNAYVIHPMLVEILEVVARRDGAWVEFHRDAVRRLTRFAAIQERMISPDGTYPILGRSIAYRCGAFQGLAFAAWREVLPTDVTPAQVRVALTSVIRRTLEAPGTFDARGWLQIGVSGHQPALGEPYISTGSLYLCAAALLPLGLPAGHRFWRDPDTLTTSQQVWSGRDIPADHAIKG